MTQVKETTNHIKVSENYAKFMAKSRMKDKFGGKLIKRSLIIIIPNFSKI